METQTKWMTIGQIGKTGVMPTSTLRKLVSQNAIPFITTSCGVLIEYNTLCSFLEEAGRKHSVLMDSGRIRSGRRVAE